jgi:hypothetical protein
MALKASGAYRHCTPCTAAQGQGQGQGPIKNNPSSSSVKSDFESDQRFKMLYGRSNSSITATAAVAATQQQQPRVWGKEMEARLKGISSGEATPKSASGRNRVDPIVFVEEKEPKEWVAQVEPGVLITFVSLPGGGNDLKRIRFRYVTVHLTSSYGYDCFVDSVFLIVRLGLVWLRRCLVCF